MWFFPTMNIRKYTKVSLSIVRLTVPSVHGISGVFLKNKMISQFLPTHYSSQSPHWQSSCYWSSSPHRKNCSQRRLGISRFDPCNLIDLSKVPIPSFNPGLRTVLSLLALNTTFSHMRSVDHVFIGCSPGKSCFSCKERARVLCCLGGCMCRIIWHSDQRGTSFATGCSEQH